jgi:uracil-DNA glycosylase family 4
VSSETELADLVALAREHLVREMDLGARYLPSASPRAARAVIEPAIEPATVAAPLAPEAAPVSKPAPVAAGDRRARLAVIAEEVKGCTKCRLHAGRTQTVFARGNPDAPVVFIGEGPGYNEDQQGLPFVGAAGQLLDKMIAAMGLGPDEFYICNVVKCRPPENRTPNPDEAAACKSYLDAQLEIVAPRAIVALGRCAAENLGLAPAGSKWRGVLSKMPNDTIVMPTYHPAYLLRSPEQKRVVWQDLQAVVAALGREIAKR